MASQESSRGRGARGRGRGGVGLKRSAPGEFAGFSAKKRRTALENCHRFLIPDELVRVIVGKGGHNIKDIIGKVKAVDELAKVSIYSNCANGDPIMEGAVDRVLGIQGTNEAVKVALEELIPLIQYTDGAIKRKKLEVRYLSPAHSASSVIGRNGSVINQLKKETKSFIQVYTVSLPYSDEVVIRIQNFELDDLVKTILKVVDAVAYNKTEKPIVFYDPIWFEQGAFGDTGSYVDTFWFQDAISAGHIEMQPFAGRKLTGFSNIVQEQTQGGLPGPYDQATYPQPAYDASYGAEYAYGAAYGYAEYSGYEPGYDEAYGNYNYGFAAIPVVPPISAPRGMRAVRRPIRARGGRVAVRRPVGARGARAIRRPMRAR